jgi:transcriptional regulator with XRE-family HTH domain
MSKKFTLETLGPVLKEARGGRGLRETANEIGTSAATLSRIESGKQPDLETFAKICKWLEVDAGEILGCSEKSNSEPQTRSAHFRADKTLKPDTARHLGELILAIHRKLESSDDSVR